MSAQLERGEVVWANDPFKGERPWVIISNGDQPFNEHIVVALTTTDREAAYPITEDDMAEGELPQESYASPWVVDRKLESEITGHCGTLTDGSVDEIVHELEAYILP